jgi:hypothetical protein
MTVEADDAEAFRDALRDRNRRHLWMEGFGSVRHQGAGRCHPGDRAGAGRLRARGRWRRSPTLSRWGLFAGGAWGQVENEIDTQQTDSTSVFGGVYAATTGWGVDWDLMLTAGHTGFDANGRWRTNSSQAASRPRPPRKTRGSSSPELTVTARCHPRRRPCWGRPSSPFLTLRYAGLFLNGFSETGVAAPLTLSDRDVHQGTARLGLHLPRSWNTGNGIMTARSPSASRGGATLETTPSPARCSARALPSRPPMMTGSSPALRGSMRSF